MRINLTYILVGGLIYFLLFRKSNDVRYAGEAGQAPNPNATTWA